MPQMVLLPSALRVAGHSGTGVRGASDRVSGMDIIGQRATSPRAERLGRHGRWSTAPALAHYAPPFLRNRESSSGVLVGQGERCQESDFPDRFSDGLIRADRRTLEPQRFLRSGGCWHILHRRLPSGRTPCVWGPTASRLYSPSVPTPQLCWRRCFKRFSLRPAAIRLLARDRPCPVSRARPPQLASRRPARSAVCECSLASAWTAESEGRNLCGHHGRPSA